jgi:succinate dehydrogenase / fumarate reductase membrane anchor subunit
MSVGSASRQAYRRRSARPAGGNFELWSWYFFRVSGVLLLVLAFGHLLIVHIINNVDVINYEFVALRWQTLGWRAYDWLLLFLAIVHGQNGLRVLIDDYVHARGWRTFAHTVNWVFLGFFLAVGTLTIVSFPFMPGLRSQ